MKALPPFGDIYLRFREEDYGRIRLPGVELQTGSKVRVYEDIEDAIQRIRELHDNRLKGT